METMNGSWEQFVEDFATLDDAEFDDEAGLDDEFAEADEEDEMDAERVRRKKGQSRRKISHGGIQGRLAQRMHDKPMGGIVQTPNGRARIALPGRIIPPAEFRKAVDALQQDGKKNATGIQQLEAQQRQDMARLTAMVAQTEKKHSQELRQIATGVVVALAAAPVVAFIQNRFA